MLDQFDFFVNLWVILSADALRNQSVDTSFRAYFFQRVFFAFGIVWVCGAFVFVVIESFAQ